LAEAGVPESQLAGVHAPMGLELNAETPEEIALSILGEIVMLRRGGSGQPMRWTPGDTPRALAEPPAGPPAGH
jgi:xanthine dehydrogenase accessory factor